MDNLITDTVKKALDDLHIIHNYDETNNMFDFAIKLDKANIYVKIASDEKQEMLMAVASCGVFAPKEKIENACRWICDKNLLCDIGYYTIDTQDGEISFRVVCPLDGGAVNDSIAKVAIANAITKMDNSYLEQLKLAYFDEGVVEIKE